MSIIQAIALETLWSKTVEGGGFDVLTLLIVIGWMQSIATLLVIIMVWMTYVGLLMRFVWTPSLLDTVLPFPVGILQFALIEFAVAQHFGYWVFCLGLLTLLVTFITQRYFRKARLDPKNEDFFKAVSPATIRDVLPEIVYAIIALAIGITTIIIQPNVWFAIVFILTFVGASGHLMFRQAKFWNQSIEPVAKNIEAADAKNP